jgi:hypothetical protein
MVKKILLGLVGAIVLAILAVSVAAMMQPDTYHVERSRTIMVAPSAVLPHLSDLREWSEWNPWDELDPSMHKTYSDPSSGDGAWYEWQGNDDVGKGKMTITRVGEDGVGYHLEFMEPFASEADIEIALRPEGNGTHVVWSMDGKNDFMGKLFGLFMDMDAMIGSDFEKGLEKLDRAATSG